MKNSTLNLHDVAQITITNKPPLEGSFGNTIYVTEIRIRDGENTDLTIKAFSFNGYPEVSHD